MGRVQRHCLWALEIAGTSQPGREFQAWGPQHQRYPVGDIAFADDLKTTASALVGLQLKADIFSAFTVCFYLRAATDKLSVAVIGGAEPPSRPNSSPSIQHTGFRPRSPYGAPVSPNYSDHI